MDRGWGRIASIREFLVEVWQEANRDQLSVLGAALAYYALFSLGPLLFLIVTIAGLTLGEGLVENRVLAFVEALAGPAEAANVRLMIETAIRPGANPLATWVGFLSMLAGAIGMVSQLKISLNAIWDATPQAPPDLISRLAAAILSYVVQIVLIVAIGVVLWLSLFATALLVAFGEAFDAILPGGVRLWIVVNQTLAFVVFFGVLAMMYRYVSDVRPRWPDVLIGSLLTATLFVIGKYAIGFYLAHSHVETAFGAAGSLVVVLVWIYYSSQILFAGAEFIKVYSRRRGPRPLGGGMPEPESPH